VAAVASSTAFAIDRSGRQLRSRRRVVTRGRGEDATPSSTQSGESFADFVRSQVAGTTTAPGASPALAPSVTRTGLHRQARARPVFGAVVLRRAPAAVPGDDRSAGDTRNAHQSAAHPVLPSTCGDVPRCAIVDRRGASSECSQLAMIVSCASPSRPSGPMPSPPWPFTPAVPLVSVVSVVVGSVPL
jgi:hypothetical protein